MMSRFPNGIGSKIGTIGLMAVGLALSNPARADVVFSGSGQNTAGTPISATADFTLSGGVFQIVITNDDVAINPASVLTNLGVTVAPSPATALPSAAGTIALTSGSSYVGAAPTLQLGQTWAYFSGGAASSGFGVGTTGPNADGNLCGGVTPTLCTGSNKTPLDGASYGLVGA